MCPSPYYGYAELSLSLSLPLSTFLSNNLSATRKQICTLKILEQRTYKPHCEEVSLARMRARLSNNNKHTHLHNTITLCATITRKTIIALESTKHTQKVNVSSRSPVYFARLRRWPFEEKIMCVHITNVLLGWTQCGGRGVWSCAM